MNHDANKVVSSNQQRISNDDRNHMTVHREIKFKDSDESYLDRTERINRRNWIFVLSFIGAIFAIILLIVLL